MCEAYPLDCGSDSGVELRYMVDALKLEQDTEPKVASSWSNSRML